MEKTVSILDGVFVMVHLTHDTISLARDRIGVKPVFYGESDTLLGVASEAKALDGLSLLNIQQLNPGTVLTYSLSSHTIQSKTQVLSLPEAGDRKNVSYEEARQTVRSLLEKAVQKRMCSDRDIGCLLSGGLDSSVIAAILAKEMRKKGKTLRTFSVGFPDSTDIVYARQVAAHIQSDHHEFLIHGLYF